MRRWSRLWLQIWINVNLNHVKVCGMTEVKIRVIVGSSSLNLFSSINFDIPLQPLHLSPEQRRYTVEHFRLPFLQPHSFLCICRKLISWNRGCWKLASLYWHPNVCIPFPAPIFSILIMIFDNNSRSKQMFFLSPNGKSYLFYLLNIR